MKNPTEFAAQAAAFADRHEMLPAGSAVLIALSGGGDSMALAACLQELAQERELTLFAAHYNHQLRGEEARRDEDFVRDWCQQQGIPLTIGRGDVAQEANAQGRGVEETARDLRYAFLAQTAQTVGADRVATAHNADDNAETVLLHLVRGAGLDGLTGIPPVREPFIRPLLTTPRADIDAYLAQKEIPHVEDATNADPAFARNRLRREVMPVLRELNPAFSTTLAGNLEHLRQDRDLLHRMAKRVSDRASVEDGRVILAAQELAGLPKPVAVRVVKQLLAKVDHHSVSGQSLAQILSLAGGAATAATLTLPDELYAWREYEALVLCPAANMPPAFSLTLLTGPGEFALENGWTILVEEETCPEFPAQEAFEWHIAADQAAFPLILRPRQTGDQLRLPGRRTKTLKKWYIDEKIPRRQRELLPVLADESGLLAAAGLGPNAPRLAAPGQSALHIQLFPQETQERNVTI